MNGNRIPYEAKPRILILTDIGGDPDDQQSLVRLLVHADLFDLEGIIPEHWTPPEHAITPEQQMDLVMRYVEAYAQVLPSLLQHASSYPTADHVSGVVKRGVTHVPFALDTGGKSEDGMEDLIGPGKDTQGSDWIIQVVDKDDARPVDISVWGGTADLAQALWKVRETRSDADVALFLSKIRVHAISDQDATSIWIKETFPTLFYVFNHARNGDKWTSCYRGMFKNGDESLTSREWVNGHVRQGHGALGALYPDETSTGPNPFRCLKEGDTPSWFYFLHNGLQDPWHPEHGGWGGRFTRNGTCFQDAEDTIGKDCDGTVATWRWRPAFQNEFAARMDRCVNPYEAVNHPPVAVLNGDNSRHILTIKALPGADVPLCAEGSSDPDGNNLACSWWVYPEAGTYPGVIPVMDPNAFSSHLTIPMDASGTLIHVILEITDDGTPCLTSYRRLIVHVTDNDRF